MSILSGVFDFLGSVIKPVSDLVDSVTTSDEEKLTLKNKLFELQSALYIKVMDYEGKMLDAKASIVNAEATGQSWLQRNWRPITMLTFLLMVVCDVFGLLTFRLPPQAWTLLQIGLGGYVVGRSAEKIVPKLMKRGE